MADAGTAVPKDVVERIQRIIDRLDAFHHQVRAVEERIEGVEALADRAQLPRVRFAARDAYVKMSDAGVKLVECHLTLGHILAPPQGNVQTGGDAHG